MNNTTNEMVAHPYKVAQNMKRYVRDILLQVHKTPTLEKMLDLTNPIDYTVIYNLDDDKKLKAIADLREKIASLERKNHLSAEEEKGLSNAKIELLEYRPNEDIQCIIMVEELLRYSDENLLGIGIEQDSELPHIYDGTYWSPIAKSLLREFLAEIATKTGENYYNMRLNKNIDKLYNQFVSLCTLAPNLNDNKEEVKINLQNGTFVISKEKKELRDFDKKDFFKYQLPFKYNPEAKCDEFKVFLNQVLPEKESQMILAEYLGYIFINNLKLEKCLILKGEGSNGKSVIFEIVQALLGEHNTCSYTISNLCNENGYFRAQLGNYLLNYSSELGGKNINPDLFKKLINLSFG